MPQRRIFLFGATSMVGFSLVREAEHAPGTLWPFFNTYASATPATVGWQRLNLEDREAVAHLFGDREPPELLIHCGGVCDVEKCERSPEWAHAVNVQSVALLLRHLPRQTRLVYCSSDHVFSGDRGPYCEQIPCDPLTTYGRTRVAAERLILAHRPDALVVRLGLCIGTSFDGRSGHLDWLRYRRRHELPMTLVADEARSTVWGHDLAPRLFALAGSSRVGIRHVVADRIVDRPRLAAFLNQHYGLGAEFALQRREQRRVPHLGRVDLVTRFDDTLATPLPSVVPP